MADGDFKAWKRIRWIAGLTGLAATIAWFQEAWRAIGDTLYVIVVALLPFTLIAIVWALVAGVTVVVLFVLLRLFDILRRPFQRHAK